MSMRMPQPALPFAAAQAYADQVEAWARQPMAPGVRVWRHVAYGTHPAQHLHVYAPEGARAAPVLVFWHGGGWTNGDPDWCAFMVPHVLRLGMVFVTPAYRLAHEARLPAAADDALAALRVVTASAPAWGGDPARLFLGGHSAGGHLAALTALRGDRGMAPPGLCGCLPISGIHDLHHPAPPPGSLEERVYTTVLARPDDDAPLSPLLWARGNRVPFDLSFGEHDSDRVQRAGRRLHAMLQQQLVRSTLSVDPGADHFAAHLRLVDGDHPWYARLTAMMELTR